VDPVHVSVSEADALPTEQFWTRMTGFLGHLAAGQPMPS
jgi:hypothetical protein